MTRVGVIGLGAMGTRIAGRLVGAGHELVVWNRDPAKTEPLARLGATAVATPAEVAEHADAVITMVRDPQALREVTEGTRGLAAASGEATVIQMSTVAPAHVLELAAALQPAPVLDAPVLGSVSEAEAGTLAMFVGGDDDLIARWTPLLSVLGTVSRVGGVGAGSAAKLVANSTLFGVLGVLGEALALADRLGLSREVAFEVLATTPLAAQAERRRPAVEAGAFPARFALSLARKDADLIAEAAPGGELRLAAAARSWLQDAERAGLGDDDYSALLAEILR